jgi:hypothetical protein
MPIIGSKTTFRHPVTEVHHQVAGGLDGSRAGRVGDDPGEVHAARGVLDHDQRVDTPQDHGVDVQEVHGEDALGLLGE